MMSVSTKVSEKLPQGPVYLLLIICIISKATDTAACYPPH